MEKVFIGQAKSGASKTKIVWTLGPESRSVEMIEKLLKAGMNVARFNFSYGSRAYHQQTLDNLRTAVQNTGILCAVMLDTKGPEIRTGSLKHGKPIELKEGQEITISVDYNIKGDSNMISVSYKKLADHLKPNDVILCCDGRVSLTVLSCDKSLGLIRCRCDNSGLLGKREKVNLQNSCLVGEGERVHLPGIEIGLPTLTKRDKKDILEWGVPNKINIIALSYTRRGSDLRKVRKLLGVHQKDIMLMAKVEDEEGVANVDEILDKADALMVARGDLRLELEPWWSDIAPKRMIQKANLLWKPVVTAIQMFDSVSARPTSEEATDVTNAVLQGTDCVMLSGVTGADPETVVQAMSRLCKEAEDSIDYRALHKKIMRTAGTRLSEIEESIMSAVTSVARKIDAKAIIIVAKTGFEAEVVAKYRPNIPVLSVVDPECPNSEVHVASRCLVYRGIIPLMGSGASKSTEELITFGIQALRNEGICQVNDQVLALRLNRFCPIMLPLLVR